jgi:exosome complex component RRP4
MSASTFVVPGQAITSEQGYLRGHGSYYSQDPSETGPTLVSSVAGQIDRVNKLISVRPIKSRYFNFLNLASNF